MGKKRNEKTIQSQQNPKKYNNQEAIEEMGKDISLSHPSEFTKVHVCVFPDTDLGHLNST